MYAISHLISSWQVLLNSAKEAMDQNKNRISEAKYVSLVGNEEYFEKLKVQLRDENYRSNRTSFVTNCIDSCSEEVEWIENINAQLRKLNCVTESVLEAGHLSKTAASNALHFLEYTKFTPTDVDALLHLVAVSTDLVVMYAKANPACHELRELLSKVVDLLATVMSSVKAVVHFIRCS